MNYQDYIKSELLVIIPVLYLIGYGLKKSALPNKRIPCVLGLVSIVLSLIWVVATSEIRCIQEVASAVFTAVTQGTLVAGATVYTNQLYIQNKKED